MPKTQTAAPYLYLLTGASVAAALTYLSVFGVRYGLDLSVYREAVNTWKAGRNPYTATFTRSKLPFTYPPFALIALTPLTLLDFVTTEYALWVAGIASITGAILILLRAAGVQITRYWWCLALGWSCISVLLVEPVRSAMDYGQIELVLMFITAVDLLWMPQRYRGILIGLAAAVKLTPLVFIGYLLVMRDFKSVTRGVASFSSCTALAWVLCPAESSDYWFHDMFKLGRIGAVTYPGNQSWYAIASRWPFHGGSALIPWLVLSLTTVALGAFITSRSALADHAGSAMLTIALTGLLVSPISWTHHWCWASLIPPMIFVRSRMGIRPSVGRLLLGIPALTCAAPYWWFRSGVAAAILDSLLPVYAGIILAFWAATEWRAGQLGSAARERPIMRGIAQEYGPASQPAEK